MKGIIFNLLEEVVVDAYGERSWDEALDRAGLDGVYTSLGNYDDAQIVDLFSVIASRTSLPVDDVHRWFGQRALPKMARRWPEFFTPHQRSLPFLRTLNSVIHPEVRKLYPGAQPPHFDFSEGPDDTILMDYHSERTMCPMAEGLTLGAGDYFGETLAITQTQCTKHGAPHCTLRIAVE